MGFVMIVVCEISSWAIAEMSGMTLNRCMENAAAEWRLVGFSFQNWWRSDNAITAKHF